MAGCVFVLHVNSPVIVPISRHVVLIAPYQVVFPYLFVFVASVFFQHYIVSYYGSFDRHISLIVPKNDDSHSTFETWVGQYTNIT